MTRNHILILAGALLLLPLATPAAHADHVGWSLGAGFQIGNAYFTLAFGSQGGYAPGYYYRTTGPVYSGGHHCSDRCFRDGRTIYHAASCPVVGAHLGHFGFQPLFLFERYAPAPLWNGRYYRDVAPWGFGRYGQYDRYDRYGHYDRYDRYQRYDHRDRYRRDDRRERYRSDDRYNRRDYDDSWRNRRDRDRHHDRNDRGRGHSSHRHHSRGHGEDR